MKMSEVICNFGSFNPLCDIPNWLTIIVELIIGGVLATLFFVRQQKQTKKLEQLAETEERFRSKRESWSRDKLIDHLKRLAELTKYQIDAINEYYYQLRIENKKSKLDNIINVYQHLIKASVDAFDTVLEQSIGLIDPQIIHECKKISRFSREKPNYLDPAFQKVINSTLQKRVSDINSIVQILQKIHYC